jgi:hypothetical protein
MQQIMNAIAITLLLGGDVMTGRGIDQALPIRPRRPFTKPT